MQSQQVHGLYTVVTVESTSGVLAPAATATVGVGRPGQHAEQAQCGSAPEQQMLRMASRASGSALLCGSFYKQAFDIGLIFTC